MQGILHQHIHDVDQGFGFALILGQGMFISAQLPVGAVAPDFTLQDTSGVPYTLSNLSNEVVVLFFVGYG